MARSESCLDRACRLLDPWDIRRAWGTKNLMLRVLEEAHTHHLFAMKRSHAVVLVHGLGRSAHSLDKLASALRAQGFEPVQFNYASTQDTLEGHAKALNLFVEGLREAQSVSFVTHSLGGLVVRHALALKTPSVPVHRVVMLAPPNQGSYLAEALSK